MPSYDYRCGDCGHEFEAFQSISADELRKCPECGKPKLRRLMGGGAAIVFKGSGFYQTDYRSDAYRKSAAADKPAAESKADATSDTKAETKNAAAKPTSTNAAAS